MNIFLLSLAILILCTSAVLGAEVELSFVDHHNLRPMYKSSDEELRAQVAEAKANLDKAKEYGIDTYILFSRSFEVLINYDFAVDGLGDLTGVAHAMNSEHRAKQKVYAQCLDEVLDYAEQLGIKVMFHTNQFDFPEKVFELAGDKIKGEVSWVCPAKPLAYELLTGKVREFFEKFPKCAGLQLTLSESPIPPLSCKCNVCKDMGAGERMAKVVEAARTALNPMGKKVSIRTWGGFESSGVAKLLPKDVIFSTKNTKGDFFLTGPISDLIGLNADSQEIEFDGWGEYAGFNYFPCYQGDFLAERIRHCFDKGVKRLAIRVNWEPFTNPIFERPLGNEVNIYMFTRLSRNPDANPDDLLREYVDSKFPESAREAVFKLFKRSWDFHVTWMTWRGENANNHTGVYRKSRRGTYMQQVAYWTVNAIPEGYETVKALIDIRRRDIDAAYRESLELVRALGPDVSEDWKRELERGARIMWFAAQACSDGIQMYAAGKEKEAGKQLPDLSELEKGIRNRAKLWQSWQPETYTFLNGEHMLYMFEEITAKE